MREARIRGGLLPRQPAENTVSVRYGTAEGFLILKIMRHSDRPATILVADDEPDIRAFVRTVLQTNGYSVLEAADGAEALQVASRYSGRIDLLLTDIRMPGTSGPELCVRIGRRRPGMRCLVMSGYADAPIARTAFLHKPFTIPELLDKVRSVLAGSLAA